MSCQGKLPDQQSHYHFLKNDSLVRFEVFTTVTMMNAVSWDVGLYSSCVDRSSSETSVHTITSWRHIPENGIVQWLSCYEVRILPEKKRLGKRRNISHIRIICSVPANNSNKYDTFENCDLVDKRWAHSWQVHGNASIINRSRIFNRLTITFHVLLSQLEACLKEIPVLLVANTNLYTAQVTEEKGEQSAVWEVVTWRNISWHYIAA
jgi:hypothetical protein